MLSVTHLFFDTVVEHPIALNEHKGSAIRGAFFHALRGRPHRTDWRGFCSNQSAPDCVDCPLIAVCPVARLLATHDPTGARGHSLPRPITVKPPLGDKGDFLPGDVLRFGLTVVGDALALLPYVILAVQQGMPVEGLGKRDRLNDYRTGYFKLREVTTMHPLQGRVDTLWREGERMVQRPAMPVTHEEVLDYAGHLSSERITLRLLTPMRLTDQSKLVRSFRFRPFFQRLMERLITLSTLFGEETLLADEGERHALLDAAEQVAVVDKTKWVDLRSYSTRRRRETPIGGLTGEVTLVGDLAPFRPWLLWGAQLHVGKDAVKGDGWYYMI
ncbi:MAG: CRISPR system precrRNA processing endoribonuclease RAMP protein Cas6 [Anaerolineales bacterium]|nr:CRISPR system precrRNA processing endoribonuclease RAMP protein Cas6 [Anaerolineales bacterium]MCB9127126.1 CRISPR system precrRNA processing endoribonuclease RAMP protein Cas6 [Ardenticatenales bacterium]